MLSRHGRYVAAIGGLVLAATAWAQEKPSRPEHNQRAPAQAANSGQGGLPVGPSVYEAQSLVIGRDANRIASLSADASTRQADYGRVQVALGALAALFTAIAAGAAIAAAIYAKKAADHTEAAAGTAKESLAHDRKVDEVQVRPYVYLASEEIEIDEMVLGMISNVGQAKVALRNYGQTPAKKVTMKATCFIGGHMNDRVIGGPKAAAKVHVGDMPPGFERVKDGYYVVGIAKAEFDIKNSGKTIFLEGLIEYRNAGGEKFKTRFRRACTGDNLGARRFTVTPHGNDAT